MASPYWEEAVYTLISRIPKGKVCSYGSIAKAAGVSNARQVAAALRKSDGDLPWFRVINSSMRVSDHPGAEQQRQLLEQEGVEFSLKGRIQTKYLWTPE